MRQIGIDPSIFNLAEELADPTAEDLQLTLTIESRDELAAALQRAFEDWASDLEPKEAEPTP